MPLVITIDQRASRTRRDHVDRWLRELNKQFGPWMTLNFARTIGDEFQGVTDSAFVPIELALRGARFGDWWTGIGIGSVELPLRESSIESRGDAFYFARDAVEQAKKRPSGFAVAAEDAGAADDVCTVLQLVAFVSASRGEGPRSEATWRAVEMRHDGATHGAIARELGISRQAVSRRLQVAGYEEEAGGKAVAKHLIQMIETASHG